MSWRTTSSMPGRLTLMTTRCEGRPSAREGRRPMHLGYRAAGKRGALKGLISIPDTGRPRLIGDNPLGFLCGEGGNAVLKQCELVDDVRRKEVWSTGHNLAELDEGRAEFFENHREPAAEGQVRLLRRAQPTDRRHRLGSGT